METPIQGRYPATFFSSTTLTAGTSVSHDTAGNTDGVLELIFARKQEATHSDVLDASTIFSSTFAEHHRAPGTGVSLRRSDSWCPRTSTALSTPSLRLFSMVNHNQSLTPPFCTKRSAKPASNSRAGSYCLNPPSEPTYIRSTTARCTPQVYDSPPVRVPVPVEHEHAVGGSPLLCTCPSCSAAATQKKTRIASILQWVPLGSHFGNGISCPINFLLKPKSRCPIVFHSKPR